MCPDPPLDTLVPPVSTTIEVPPVVEVPPIVPPKEHGRVCGFCHCTLDARGGVLKRGDRVQEMLDAEDAIRDLKRKLAEADAKIIALTSERDEARRKVERYNNRKFGEIIS